VNIEGRFNPSAGSLRQAQGGPFDGLMACGRAGGAPLTGSAPQLNRKDGQVSRGKLRSDRRDKLGGYSFLSHTDFKISKIYLVMIKFYSETD